MNKHLADALTSSLSADARAFGPELFLCFSIVFLLLVRLLPRYDRLHVGWLALFLSVIALAMSFLQWPGAPALFGDASEIPGAFDPRSDSPTSTVNSMGLFGGMLIFDNFTVFLKLFLFSFTTLVIILTLTTGIPDREDSADFYTLLLGSTVGMSMMASSNHLLMVFLSIEMASLPSYALAGFLKGRRQSSEAALKYVVYGGGASGVMLYGISLIAGKFGTGYLPNLVAVMTTGQNIGDPVVLLGLLFILTGIGFKLAAVPFHFWCPDVFEGAAAEVGAFLSVASKGAALALLARIVLGMGALADSVAPELAQRSLYDAWHRATDYLVPILTVFSIITMTFGNLAAYGQDNLKRLLAYSTIAHAGFMMMGLATMTRDGAGAVLFYLVVYLFMNLGAFAVVAFMRNINHGHEDMTYYRGFVYRSPVLVIMLGVFLLSLLGLPPLAGFAAKFQIFSVLFDAAQVYQRDGRPFLSYNMYALVVAGGLNTVLSLFYYVKVLKVMVLEKTLEEVEDRPIEEKQTPIAYSMYATVLAFVILALGLFWNPLSVASSEDHGVNAFRDAPPPKSVQAPTPPIQMKGPGPMGVPKGKKGVQ